MGAAVTATPADVRGSRCGGGMDRVLTEGAAGGASKSWVVARMSSSG